jgi:hypothetical protein
MQTHNFTQKDATNSYKETTTKSCKTYELGFSRLVEVRKPLTIGEGRGGKIK